MSTPDKDDDELPTSKKSKQDEILILETVENASQRGESPAATVPEEKESEEVKEVTAGVKEVELEENQDSSLREPINTPLPDSPKISEQEVEEVETTKSSSDEQKTPSEDETDTVGDSIDSKNNTEEGVPSEIQPDNLEASVAEGTADHPKLSTKVDEDVRPETNPAEIADSGKKED